MEERKFLHKLCVIALQVDYSIEFAGIVDSNGKLLAGRSRDRSYYDNYFKKKKNNSPFKHSDLFVKAVFNDKTISSNNMKNIVSIQSNLVEDHILFKLINLNNNVFLAYMPIIEPNDKFLYIYFRKCDYLEDVLSQLNSTFS